MATVDLIEVSKKAGSAVILDKVSASIKKGEFMVVVGPSGCGKSSLLRLIAGLDEPSGGVIHINNQCVNKIPAAKRDIAMVFQNYALYPHMTVFDNMAYGLKMRGFARQDIQQRVTEAAKLLQLMPYLERKPKALSGGQKQRVAMGRAIVRSPALFLFDEPLSNLDAKLRTEMRHEIKRLHQKFNITSLYVTHDQTEAMTMADRVLILNQGVVEQTGTPQELYQNPSSQFVAGFIGHYPINQVAGIFDKRNKTIRTELGTEYPALAGMHDVEDSIAVTLAVRPEHLQFCDQSRPNSVEVRLEFVDDMGADKLVQVKSVKNGMRINLRVSAEQALSHDPLFLELPANKVHVFDKLSGKRIGG